MTNVLDSTRPDLCRRAAHALAAVLLGCGVAACASAASEAPAEEGTRVIQPGAPGQPSRILSDPDSAQARIPEHTEGDVAFMTGMIGHHAQAIVMARLAPERTDDPAILAAARRIERSQIDEIALISRWLEARGEPVPATALDESDFSAMRMGHGMLTRTELAELSAARDGDFDRLFLQLMIRHHEGALTMVRDLFDEGGGLETSVSRMANEVNMDQSIEISRMVRMLQEKR